MQRNLQKLNLKNEVPGIIRSTSGTLISLNKKQLFNEGVNSLDKIIGRYSIFTEARNPLKKAGSPYTLKDKGDFYRGFNILVTNDAVIFNSSDPKTQMLESNYGTEIFGLTDTSKIKYIPVFYTRLKQYINSVTGLKFVR
jgi:hypothetical protein